MKGIIRFLFVLFSAVFLISSCSKDDKSAVENPGQTDDIDVIKGMTLIGKITDEAAKPIRNVVVTDGFTCVKTDETGVYQMKRNQEAVFVYYSVPSDCEVKANKGIPGFYARIDQKKKIFRQDFTLSRLAAVEQDFTLLCIADPQCKTDGDLERFKTETLADIKTNMDPSRSYYGVTLGDITFDKPVMFSSMKAAMNIDNLKIFQTIGNHDHFEYGTSEQHCVTNYQNTFGPTDYSFNRGKVHVVCMDDVIYTGKQTYSGGFTDEQVEWLKQDLSFVPKDHLVILCVHIPTRNSSSIRNCQKVYELMKPFAEAHVMSGHTHYNQNYQVATYGIYEHIHGAACGNWWTCTINGDGTPNGYGVYEIRGNHIANWYYKGVNLDKSEQIRMYPVGSFADNSNNLVANIWNADEDWQVQVYEDGILEGNMTRFTDYEKAVYQFFYQVMNKPLPSTTNGTTSWYRRPDHLYKYIPKSMSAKFEIKARDRFGNTYTQDEFTTDFRQFQRY